jgi:hypothetical protein
MPPGSPAARGGSPAAQRPLERACTDRSAGGCADRPPPVTACARATVACHRAQPRVVPKGWGKRRAPAGVLLLLVEVQHAACCGSRERHMVGSRILRSRQERSAEETSTSQEDVDTLRGPERSDDGCSSGLTWRSLKAPARCLTTRQRRVRACASGKLPCDGRDTVARSTGRRRRRGARARRLRHGETPAPPDAAPGKKP